MASCCPTRGAFVPAAMNFVLVCGTLALQRGIAVGVSEGPSHNGVTNASEVPLRSNCALHPQPQSVGDDNIALIQLSSVMQLGGSPKNEKNVLSSPPSPIANAWKHLAAALPRAPPSPFGVVNRIGRMHKGASKAMLSRVPSLTSSKAQFAPSGFFKKGRRLVPPSPAAKARPRLDVASDLPKRPLSPAGIVNSKGRKHHGGSTKANTHRHVASAGPNTLSSQSSFVSTEGRRGGNRQPHIVLILVDDLGYADVGFNLNEADEEVVSPTIDKLAREGVQLGRHYAHFACSPSRSALHSGRLPVMAQMENSAWYIPGQGVNLQMTTLGEKLNAQGYSAHAVGKWDLGMATMDHMPKRRGYKTFLGYFSKGNDMWTQRVRSADACPGGHRPVDLWNLQNGVSRRAQQLDGDDHIEYLFMKRLNQIIYEHNASQPLFLYYAPHIAHCPVDMPASYANKFNFLAESDAQDCGWKGDRREDKVDPKPWGCRKQLRAAVAMLDDIIASMVSKLRTKGMWDDTLVVFGSDNGGWLRGGASNFPLRGGKGTYWEGGVRVPGFVSGGALPSASRGTRLGGMVHLADWYTTLAKLGGAEATDTRGDAAGLPQVNGLDMWPYLTGVVDASPRQELPLGPGVFLSGRWKLMLISEGEAIWTSVRSPNTTTDKQWAEIDAAHGNCSRASPCLYDVDEDPGEHNDLALQNPEMVDALRKRFDELRPSFVGNINAGNQYVMACDGLGPALCACWTALNVNQGFVGPYAWVDEVQRRQMLAVGRTSPSEPDDEPHLLPITVQLHASN
eukprot:TRINITY_DN5799_c0_g1_i2.p1 TRINITY_DN5799_c0_g1~~TRINITY_DN5799_c0_g1_i2.p1  ORF type:complete len:791 (+),score=141.82 TRINITY_DN5799_c0_g1_i2:75-2447(+)